MNTGPTESQRPPSCQVRLSPEFWVEDSPESPFFEETSPHVELPQLRCLSLHKDLVLSTFSLREQQLKRKRDAPDESSHDAVTKAIFQEFGRISSILYQ